MTKTKLFAIRDKNSKVALGLISEELKASMEVLLPTFDFVEVDSFGFASFSTEKTKFSSITLEKSEIGSDSEMHLIRDWINEKVSFGELYDEINN